MADQSRPSVCLDIAIDHRLRPLFRPLNTACDSSQGDHVRLIRRLGHDLLRDGEKICSDEIEMAAYLAMPPTMGGICFVLQQPANNHPYHLDVDTVVALSPTIRALLLEFGTLFHATRPNLPFSTDYLSSDVKMRLILISNISFKNIRLP
jgi:hypothetical protein